MVAKSETVGKKVAPSRRMSRRILQEEAYRRLQEEAYRRIMTGDMPETLSGICGAAGGMVQGGVSDGAYNTGALGRGRNSRHVASPP